MIDIKDAIWGICKNCNHPLAEVTEVTIIKEGKTEKRFEQRKILHGVPVNFSQRCNQKTCSCGGDGFEIYGKEKRNEKCGICNEGIICNCSNPIPQTGVI